jgi:hypothetical protein
MIVSELNPIQLWAVTPTAYADIADVIDLASFGVTFNTEDKDTSIQDRVYFHIVKYNDVHTIEIVVDDETDEFLLSGRYQDGSQWQDFPFTLITGKHFRTVVDLSLYPDIADSKIFFVLANTTDSQILYVSDHHQVKTTVKKSVLITYSSNAAFDNVLANVEMKYRVPGMFYFEEYPEEIESETLSDGTVAELTSSVKTQRELYVELVPDYVHRKIKLILQSSNKTIKGQSWKKEAAYEMEKPPVLNYPMRRGKGLLTLDGSIIRNVYST